MIVTDSLRTSVCTIAFNAGLLTTHKGVGVKYISSLIKEQLTALIPTSGYIAKNSERVESEDCVWIVDPMDGVQNYLNGLPYAISIALRDEGTRDIVLGVIYSPLDNTTIYAVKGEGAYKLTSYGKARLTVPSKELKPLGLVGMPTHKEDLPKTLSILESMYNSYGDVKSIGPASLDICRVACGHAQKYVQVGLRTWNICAGKLILGEAGGYYQKIGDTHIFSGVEL